tara:strand:+ start:239 stop:370 length:132 start_codon:yes stop_codon:yes gene_type:complete
MTEAWNEKKPQLQLDIKALDKYRNGQKFKILMTPHEAEHRLLL